MKRLSVLIAMGAIALMANGASAETHSRHRAHQTVVNSYAYAPVPVRESQSLSDRFQHPYESESLGRQSFPNPDRVFTTGNYP
jgi:hypothetical protein